MPKTLPSVDNDIFEALQALAVPPDDDINSVLRRLLGLSPRTDPEATAATETATTQIAPSSTSGARATRAPRGSGLPEADFELAMLTYLTQHRWAPASEVVDAIGIALKDRFTASDLETLDSGTVRWRNRAQFIRLELTREGMMTKDARYGIWEITDLGRQRVALSVAQAAVQEADNGAAFDFRRARGAIRPAPDSPPSEDLIRHTRDVT